MLSLIATRLHKHTLIGTKTTKLQLLGIKLYINKNTLYSEEKKTHFYDIYISK